MKYSPLGHSSPRDQVHLMVDTIKTAFKARVNQLEWIEDQHAKEAIIGIIQKLRGNEIFFEIGKVRM